MLRKYYKRKAIDSARPQIAPALLGTALCWAVLTTAAGCRTLSENGKKAQPLSLDPRASQSASILALYSQGISLQDRGELPRAADMFLQALEMDPHSARLCQRLAACYVDSGRISQGVEGLSRLSQTAPDSFPLQRWLALLLQLEGKSRLAEQHYRKAIELDPGAHEPPLELAVILLAEGRDSAAIDLLESAESSVDTPYEMAALRAGIHSRLAARSDSREAAVEHRRAAIAALESISGPENGAFRRQLALIQLYTLNRHFAPAFRIVDDLLAGEDADALKREIAVYTVSVLIREDEDDLVEAISDLRGDYAGNVSMLLFLGDLLAAIDHSDAALEFYQTVIEADSASAAAYIKAALILLQDDQGAALALVDRALETLPDSPELWAIRARLRISNEAYPAAIEDLERAIGLLRAAEQAHPKTLAVYIFWLASARERIGDIERAAQGFEECIELAPDFAEAYNYIAYMWAEAGLNLGQAREMAGEALRLDPGNGAYIDTLAWIDYREGHYRDALEGLKRAHRMLPDDPTILDHLGDVYSALGRTEEAIDAWRQALEFDPGNEKIAEKLRRHPVPEPFKQDQ